MDQNNYQHCLNDADHPHHGHDDYADDESVLISLTLGHH